MIIVFLFFLISVHSSFSAPKGVKTGVTFDKALPEDISNENFPDRIDSFDFPNASLLDLVKAIGKLTGINFIVDPDVQGKKISIIAPSPITVAEAYKAFLSALAANKFTVVKSGAFWKISSTAKAHEENTEVYGGDYFPNTDQLITRIIRLKHLDATEFKGTIKQFLSNGHKAQEYKSTNSIIISDYGSVIERIMKIVNEMDTPGSEEGIEIIPIEYASAGELAQMLSALLSVKGSSSRSSYIPRSGRNSPRISLSPSVKGNSSGRLKISNIIMDERTNSLVVSANKEGIKRVRELVRKLDQPVDASRLGGVYVYNVLYGTAEDVYNTLMGIKPSESKGTRTASSNIFSPSHRGAGFGSFSKSKGSAESPLFGKDVTIMADTNTNSLIISAKNKYDYERVKAVLKKIDVPRDQVFIQAIIVEMLVNDVSNKEINLVGAVGSLFTSIFNNTPLHNNAFFKDVLGSSIGGFLQQPIGAEMLKQPQIGPGVILGLPFTNLLSAVFGNKQNGVANFRKHLDSNKNLTDVDKNKAIGAYTTEYRNFENTLQFASFPLLNLLKDIENVNILSTPQLTTLDNVPAYIEVGENAPVGLTSTATAGGAFAQNSVNREDVTLRLDIIPRINPESETIQMDIKNKFDDFSTTVSSASELASRGVHILKREIQTKMVLNNGETAVLGGLLKDKETRGENKVPFLGDIPLLGWLFKSSSARIEKRNLLVFITPTIIKGKRQKEQGREILGKKLEERIHFIKKYMKGKDPHGEILQNLIPHSKKILDNKKKTKKKRKWFFWQSSSPDEEASDNQKSEGESKAEELDRETTPAETDHQEEIESPHPDLLDEEPEVLSEEEEEKLRPEDYELAVPTEEEEENTESSDTEEEDEDVESEPNSLEEDEDVESELPSPEDEDTGELDKGSLGDKEEELVPIPPEDLSF